MQDILVTKFQDIQNYSRRGVTRSYKWRVDQLNALKKMLVDCSPQIESALYNDLGKSSFESYLTEVNILIAEIDHTMHNLKEWMKDELVDTPIALQPAKSYIQYEPLGVVLIMGAWNYPFQLTLGPLIPAIAAGNCAVVKPPRTASHTTQCIRKFLPQYLDKQAFWVTEEQTSNDAMLDLHWDKIFVTGSGRVGKVVMEAAAKRLIPVTLELGGKSPAFIDKSCNLEVAVRRLVQGKFMNSGQTCVAPDYVLLDKSIAAQFYSLVKRTITDFFGENAKDSNDYGRIINQKTLDGLVGLMKDQEVLCGGDFDREARYISPTVLKNVSLEAPIMQDEIFGPILPVVEIDTMEQGVDIVHGKDKPLALYVFAEDRNVVDKILNSTSSGGSCVNDCLFHLAVPDLPFGGVGPAGMGKYHGKHGFLDLSNAKSVYDHKTGFDPSLRFPPFSDTKIKKMKKMLNTSLPSCLAKSRCFSNILNAVGSIFMK
ncbi:aldehyde dehydrogenase family protein [Halosquirtibacter laminarini]|uniref:Aldehyde dehydrogenase family protein n=1 Tax=Halosquirtibacter laminarini TaxID=3374600 RepID=A0AC61NFD6_9BACT|nr:aldehyde dehydrogenase family protein [Prolixibacteraceae bacterium]